MFSRFMRILWVDFVALACAFAIPMVWAIHFAFPYLQGFPPSENMPPWLPLSVTLLCLAVLFHRVRRIEMLFRIGRKTEGVITFVNIVKDRGRVEFAYEVGGTPVSTWMAVHKCRAVLALREGKPVTVLYDPHQPRRAIVRSLFE